MRKYILCVLTCLMVLTAGLAAAEKDPDNPKPAADDLILPMPDGGSMVFRPVYLGVGDDPFGMKEFKMGDRAAGGYKEYPTVAVLGGSFIGEKDGKQDWLYYMGKYEVTKGQYNRFMTPALEGDTCEAASNVSWFDVQDFVNRYNVWLYEQARDKLPVLDESPAYVRLPTEQEWEFAARGGSQVTPAVFDKKHPYSKGLGRYEWFSGPKSSHDKLKKCGLLSANPLGLYDMLGNVSEMTVSPYQIEYYQGRIGGFTARGGNFRTPGKSMRASQRVEQPFYRNTGEAARQKELGFRLVLSVPVFAGSATAAKLSDAWESYRQTRNIPSTAAQSTAPIAQKTSFSMDDALKSLKQLSDLLKDNPSTPPEAMDQLGLLNASFGDMQSVILKAETDSASAWVRMASFTAFFLRGELKKIPASERVIEISKQTGRTADIAVYEARHRNLLANIDDATAQYGVIMGELAKIAPEKVKTGFDMYEKYLIELGLTDQIKVNRLVFEQYTEYAQTHRLNMDEWQAQLTGF